MWRNEIVVWLLFISYAPCLHAELSDSSLVAPASVSLSTPSSCADSPEIEHINTTRLVIVSGIVAVTSVAIHVYQANGWWKDNTAPFHFQEDLRYGLNVDKLGHFYAASGLAFLFKKSLLWGAGGAALFQTYVEIEDGFHTWGFDRVDFAADVLGAGYPVAQHYVPFLQNFNFKFSYHASPLLDKKGLDVGFKGQKHILLDDYEGQTAWLSFKMKNLLPKPVGEIWPSWLCLALGYGARNVGTATEAYRVYFLALDFDVVNIIPQDTPFLRTLSEALNFIHLPAPAVRFAPNTAWFGFYF
jgi:hypothetical protein